MNNFGHLAQRPQMPQITVSNGKILIRGVQEIFPSVRCLAGAGSHAQNMTLEGLTRALGFILYGYCVFLFVFTAIMALSKPPYLALC